MLGTDEKLVRLAKECIRLSGEERPELVWLKGIYERFRSSGRVLSKQEADNLLYEKMYSCVPVSPADTLKIRYWRTGRHMPVNREQCLMFGKAMEMDRKELDYLVKGYYDRNDLNFEKNGPGHPVYQKRKALMGELVKEYLSKIHSGGGKTGCRFRSALWRTTSAICIIWMQ